MVEEKKASIEVKDKYAIGQVATQFAQATVDVSENKALTQEEVNAMVLNKLDKLLKLMQ